MRSRSIFSPLLDQIQRVVDDGIVLQAEEVHLDQAHALDRLGVVLRHDDAVLLFQRHQLIQRVLSDHDPAGMAAGVAREALDLLRGIEQRLHRGVGFVRIAQLLDFFQRLLDGDGVRGDGGNHLGHAVGQLGVEPHGTRGVLHRSAGGEGSERDDVGDFFLAVLLLHVSHDLVAALVGEVHVDVRRGDAVGVQEALE
jgi:hypothetical protein